MPRKRKDPGGYGGAHASRGDLTQPNRVASGQQYGQRQAQEQAQRSVPLPRVAAPAPPPAQAGPPPGSPAAAAAAQSAEQRALQAAEATPFRPVGLAAPSQRPNEPVTAGLPAGMTLSPADELRAIYSRFPSETLREMIEELDA